MIELRLLIELQVGIIRENVACLSHCYDVRMISELLVGNRTMILPLLVLMEVELDQVCLRQRCPCNGVFMMFLDIRDNR